MYRKQGKSKPILNTVNKIQKYELMIDSAAESLLFLILVKLLG